MVYFLPEQSAVGLVMTDSASPPPVGLGPFGGNFFAPLGTLGKLFRLVLTVRLPEENFPQSVKLRIYVGRLQPHSRSQWPLAVSLVSTKNRGIWEGPIFGAWVE